VSTLGRVIGILVRLVALIAWLLTLPWRLARRLAVVPRGTYLRVEIDGPIDEVPVSPSWWPLVGRRPFSLRALAELVEEMTNDARVAGILLVVKSARGGFATAASLRGVLARARSGGKHVLVHLPLGGGTKETYAAVAADRVLLGPQASLAPVGFLAGTRYVRGALDRAGLVPEVHARGRYKTAAESIERTEMSDAQREQLEALLDRLHEELVRAIAEGRKVDDARARACIDAAPYMGHEAVAAGLADGVAYEDEVSAADGSKTRFRDADRYMRSRHALRSNALRSRGTIAVLRVHGAIASSPAFPLTAVAIDERVISAVRLARVNPLVRGAILHVDSPGGGALASDRIHHELARFAAEKPLVACMGDVAASGGYYVAAAAHEIVAQPTTITGSIGVIAARVVAEPLLARLGVKTELLQRGAHARLLDPIIALDDDAKRAIDREFEQMYRAFVQVVARGRRRSVEEIEPLAQGRVWIGADAHARGLVDRLGGLGEALKAVRARIGRGAGNLRVLAVRAPRWQVGAAQGDAVRAFALAIEPLVRAAGLDASVLSLAGERVLAYSALAASLRS
jgi:protease IV